MIKCIIAEVGSRKLIGSPCDDDGSLVAQSLLLSRTTVKRAQRPPIISMLYATLQSRLPQMCRTIACCLYPF